jgi:hypothetical protein
MQSRVREHGYDEEVIRLVWIVYVSSISSAFRFLLKAYVK